MTSTKLIVAYPQSKDAEAFDAVYEKEHVPMAIANLDGKTKIVATKMVQSQGVPFYRIAEVHFPSMEALQRCAESPGGKATLAHAAKISSGTSGHHGCGRGYVYVLAPRKDSDGEKL